MPTARSSSPLSPSGAPPSNHWLNAAELGASGSEFETKAKTVADSNRVQVASLGDFKPNQEVIIKGGFIDYENAVVFGRKPGGPIQRAPLTNATLEMRGYEGRADRLIYLITITPETPNAFRWSDDRGRIWNGPVSITHDWQSLSHGIEIRINRRDWASDLDHAVWFSARNQLVSTIERIEGNTLILKDKANLTNDEATVQHCDNAPLQGAIDRAITEKKNLFIPAGRYRLTKGLKVSHASGITIEGSSGVDTILDISQAVSPLHPWEAGAILLEGGKEITLRNLFMVGNSGFAERDQVGGIRIGRVLIWGFYLKGSNAVTILNTEQVLIENCHARKMATECFYSQGTQEAFRDETKKVATLSITYLRCSVEDCGRNAFNNNDLAENTNILYCRIKDVGGCTWEGASRFVRFVGNYVHNAGTVAMGNVKFRSPHLEERGTGQHIVADNVFEGHTLYGHREGGVAVRAHGGATQVIVKNNLFVNYKGSGAIEVSGIGGTRHLPTGQAIITGNIIDMTSDEQPSIPRTAIISTATDLIVSGNQIYVRGQPDPMVTGIRLGGPGININVNDNLIRNCGNGILTKRSRGTVGRVVDRLTFVPKDDGHHSNISLEKRQSHRYQGWHLAWMGEDGPIATSTVASYNPENFYFTLSQPYAMEEGLAFEIFAPFANWNIHHNTITGCLRPVSLDHYGSSSSVFSDNTISRDGGNDVSVAVSIHGQFLVKNNIIQGFDEAGSAAIALCENQLGHVSESILQGNIIRQCASGIHEAEPGIWDKVNGGSNLFKRCETEVRTDHSPPLQKNHQ